MKLTIEKEIKELYYLATRWGSRNWGSKKTFVRTDYEKKDGTLGSYMYCSADNTALLFDNYEDALKLKNMYNVSGEEVKLFNFNKYLKNNKLIIYGKERNTLRPMVVNGINCYKLI